MFRFFLCVLLKVSAIPFIDSIYVEFDNETLANIVPGKEFKLPFKIQFPDLVTRNSTHLFEKEKRPDRYQMFVSLDGNTTTADRKVYYDQLMAKKVYEYDADADFLIPSYTVPGTYKIKVEFENLDRILIFKKTVAYSQTFTIGTGSSDFDEYFTRNSDGNDTQVSVFYQVWNEVEGPKRQLIAQLYKNSVITTKRA